MLRSAVESEQLTGRLIAMSLLSPAKDFLVESLDNYEKNKLAFSILHAVTATELILKERLSRVHPSLIFRKIDSHQLLKERTLALKELPQRLMNFGVELDSGDLDVIRTVSIWRHAIVHHMPTFQPKQAKTNLGLLYDFIARFLAKELELQFKEFIPKSSYKVVNGLIKEWNKVLEEAKNRAQKEGNILVSQECRVCCARGTICLRKDRAFCHLCESDLIVGECPICHKQAADTDADLEGNVYHWDCLDGMASDYVEMMREAYLGK
jgi:hypothetical protein